MAKKIPVMEIFGPTIQGEGMVIGRKTMFLRTGGCDYGCAWCDSAFTWNGEEKAKIMTATEAFLEIIRKGTTEDATLNFNHVTISGGNPALVGEPMEELIDMLHEADIRVGLETQGSIWKDWMYKIDDLTISPKPPSSKMKTDFNKLDNIINKLDNMAVIAGQQPNHTLKVVVFDDADFEFAKEVHKRYPHIEFYVSVGNVDAKEEGDISGRLLRKLDWLWNKVLEDPEANDFRPLPQLHTLVWANKRGV
ncbi:radical SAM superfamily protein [Weizmannia phage Youna2]